MTKACDKKQAVLCPLFISNYCARFRWGWWGLSRDFTVCYDLPKVFFNSICGLSEHHETKMGMTAKWLVCTLKGSDWRRCTRLAVHVFHTISDIAIIPSILRDAHYLCRNFFFRWTPLHEFFFLSNIALFLTVKSWLHYLCFCAL